MRDVISLKLNELEKTANDFWNIPPESGNLINMTIKAAGYKNILEVGTSNGYSAIWISDALNSTNGKLISIEFYEKRIKLAKQNLSDCDLLDNVTILEGSAGVLLKDIKAFDYNCDDDQFIDFAFVDACKGEYKNYFDIIHPNLKVGGILAADNVTSHKDSVSEFLEAIDSHPDYQVQYFPFGGGILFALKVA